MFPQNNSPLFFHLLVLKPFLCLAFVIHFRLDMIEPLKCVDRQSWKMYMKYCHFLFFVCICHTKLNGFERGMVLLKHNSMPTFWWSGPPPVWNQRVPLWWGSFLRHLLFVFSHCISSSSFSVPSSSSWRENPICCKGRNKNEIFVVPYFLLSL